MLLSRETGLDQFANDFFSYVCRASGISNIWRIKVIACDPSDWTSNIPAPIRTKLGQICPLIIVYGQGDQTKVSTNYRSFCMKAVGFRQEQIEALNPFDMLLFLKINIDQPNRYHEDLTHHPLVIIAHQVLHLLELTLRRKIIIESDSEHDYDERGTIDILRMFVQDSGGVEQFLYRYG